MSSPTEANMFHLPEQNRGVQVWDEVEVANPVERSKFQSVKAIFLVGYRNGGVVPRQVGKNWDKQVKYHVYCPRVVIGLSRLPEPAQQRSIELRLRKRMPGQEAQIYRMDDQAKEEAHLRAKCVLTALKCADGVNQLFRDEALRTNIEALLGKAGREADDIWLPLFAIVAACSSDTKIDPEQNSLLGDLAKAAKELARFRENPMSEDRQRFPRAAAASCSDRSEPDEPHEALVAALDILESGPIEPRDLAKRVSVRVSKSGHREVTAQWLSKNLRRRFRIRAAKQNGRRVFKLLPREIQAAKAKLGVVPSFPQEIESGQQGQEGQDLFETA